MASFNTVQTATSGSNPATHAPARWSAVYAMALCSFVLVASEFLPVSLLSPIAATLALTEGQAGQAIAISGLFAVIASLTISALLGRADRRRVLLALIAMLVVSGTMVAFAPGYPVLMVGRAILGIAIGGFWSMSAAIAMRLVPAQDVPKALAIINGGNALASTLAAPIGSFMGGLIGWRGTFFCIVPTAVLAIVWQVASLPPLPGERARNESAMLGLLRRPPLVFGLLTVALLFAGQFALFTYLRPFLEQITQIGVSMLSLMLLIIGVSGFMGTIVIGRVLGQVQPQGQVQVLFLTLGVLPAAMAAAAILLAAFGASLPITAILLAIWGFASTAAPVAWWTWLARTVPDEAEAGGGLMVAIVQLAITLGATLGGVVFDMAGARVEFLTSAGLLVAATLAAFALARRLGA
ncbi:MFS transporter [Novosphingobium sp. KA1]|uniref:MFS transporter n=1 Tax=Novosphingobium sp. (strain KA1) TaxID=164608 RepID=UPI001A8D437F|nr:MFS transporter [Novosphingobium sp. KA1]QSR19017.1 MFS transporter [Novosphingobium sp. KA1]